MNNYWKNRFLEEEEYKYKDARAYLNTIEKQYNKAIKNIEKDITYWYNRIAKNNEISLKDAKELLSKKELEEFKWTVEEYIEKGKENAISKEWMKQLENASARVHISKLESLKIQIQNEIEGLYGERLEGMSDYLTRVYKDTYYKSCFITQVGTGVGKSLNILDTEKISTIIHKPWAKDGKNFSDRIWEDKIKLINTLHTELTQAFIRGSSVDEIIKEISREMNVKKSIAGRLVMTETAAYSSQAKQKTFKDLDVEKYEIIATLDTSTSEICKEMDGKVFSMKDYQIGITASPFHPNCRTTEAPYFEDDVTSMRAARDENNNSIYVPADMKYQEWYDKFIMKETGKSGIIEEKRKFNSFIEAKEGLEKKGVIFKNNLSKLDERLLLDNANKLNELLDKYAEAQNYIKENTFTFDTKKGSFIGMCSSKIDESSQTIYLNPEYFKDYTKYIEQQMNQIKSKWKMPASEEKVASYTISHEFGHFIQNILFKKIKEKNPDEWEKIREKAFSKSTNSAVLKVIRSWYNNQAKIMKKDIILMANKLDSNINLKNYKEYISEYGESSPEEFFAECFANLECGNPNILGKAIENYLKEVF